MNDKSTPYIDKVINIIELKIKQYSSYLTCKDPYNKALLYGKHEAFCEIRKLLKQSKAEEIKAESIEELTGRCFAYEWFNHSLLGANREEIDMLEIEVKENG